MELIVDNFAGGGGASTGIEQAIGRPIDIAINHDSEAIAMHTANHPNTKHFCEDGPVGLAWFSPDCKHFSKAKGGKPVSKKIRGLAWVAVRWAATVKPRIIMLENVEEFVTWGPLGPDGQPCKQRKGQTFDAFVRALKRQGYQVEYRELRASDYGAPTIRNRLFLIARCDGQPIVWPEPTHDKSNWRTAAECIDWSLPCPSIFERKRPLADATLRRIARGIQKYVIDAQEPFIVTCNHGGDEFRGCSVNEPLMTLTASRDAHGVVVPTLITVGYGERPGQEPRVPGLEKPMGTIVAEGNKHALVAPTLIQMGFGEAPGSPPRCIDPHKPLGTVAAGAVKHAVAVAALIKHYGGNYVGDNIQLKLPMHTVTSTDHHALIAANLVRFFGTSTGSDLNEPAPTVMPEGMGKTGLVAAFLSKYNGSKGTIGQDLREPMHTATSNDRFALVTINSVNYVIADIGMRMLQPHELYAAQGFPPDYIIAPKIGKKPLSKEAQTRMCGNSVCPPVARALVSANFQELRAPLREEVAV